MRSCKVSYLQPASTFYLKQLRTREKSKKLQLHVYS